MSEDFNCTVSRKWFFDTAGVTRQAIQAHSSLSKQERAYRTVEGWVDDKVHGCCSWGAGEVSYCDKPLTLEGDRVVVRVQVTTSSVDIYAANITPPVRVAKLNPDQTNEILGKRVELRVTTGVGDMYRNGVGRRNEYR